MKDGKTYIITNEVKVYSKGRFLGALTPGTRVVGLHKYGGLSGEYIMAKTEFGVVRIFTNNCK